MQAIVIDHGAIESIQPIAKYKEPWWNIVPEVLSGLGDGLAIKADDDATEFLIAVSNIKVNLFHSLAPIRPPTQYISIPCA
jgi:hypothetical protein